MGDSSSLGSKIEELKVLLVATATGACNNEEGFRSLRTELWNKRDLRPRLPEFLGYCRSLSEFWAFIQPKFAHYRERRQFLRDAFDPVLRYLEDGPESPHGPAVEGTLDALSSDAVKLAWSKALDRCATDPEGAITAARTLLESVCKHLLEEYGAVYSDTEDLPGLYRLTTAQLHLAPDQHADKLIRGILGSCTNVVGSLGSLRNMTSDAHGGGRRRMRPAVRHARLAVDLAGAVVAFLVSTWQERSADRA